MHWLALVLSDHPHQEHFRYAVAEETTGRAGNRPSSWRSAPDAEPLARSVHAPRCVPALAKSAPALS